MMQNLRFLHACQNAPAFDIYDNGILLIQWLKMYEYTEYISVLSGIHKITIYVAGTKKNPVISKKFRVLPGTSTTIMIGGSLQTIYIKKKTRV